MHGIILLESSDTLPFVVVGVGVVVRLGALLTVGVVVVFRLGSLLTQVMFAGQHKMYAYIHVYRSSTNLQTK